MWIAVQIIQVREFFKWAFGTGGVRGSCAYSIGYNSGLMRYPDSSDLSAPNPYFPHTEDWSEWRAGYQDGCDATFERKLPLA
jgi:hypothetical protein